MSMKAVGWLSSKLGVNITGREGDDETAQDPSPSAPFELSTEGSDAFQLGSPSGGNGDRNNFFGADTVGGENTVSRYWKQASSRVSQYLGGMGGSRAGGLGDSLVGLVGDGAGSRPAPARASAFGTGAGEDFRENAEIDENGLPVTKNWYYYSKELGRWEVTPEAPESVRREHAQKLREAEEERLGLKKVAPPPPPPPPGGGGMRAAGAGFPSGPPQSMFGAGGHRAPGPHYAVPDFFHAGPQQPPQAYAPYPAHHGPQQGAPPVPYPPPQPTSSSPPPPATQSQWYGAPLSGSPHGVPHGISQPPAQPLYPQQQQHQQQQQPSPMGPPYPHSAPQPYAAMPQGYPPSTVSTSSAYAAGGAPGHAYAAPPAPPPPPLSAAPSPRYTAGPAPSTTRAQEPTSAPPPPPQQQQQQWQQPHQEPPQRQQQQPQPPAVPLSPTSLERAPSLGGSTQSATRPPPQPQPQQLQQQQQQQPSQPRDSRPGINPFSSIADPDAMSQDGFETSTPPPTTAATTAPPSTAAPTPTPAPTPAPPPPPPQTQTQTQGRQSTSLFGAGGVTATSVKSRYAVPPSMTAPTAQGPSSPPPLAAPGPAGGNAFTASGLSAPQQSQQPQQPQQQSPAACSLYDQAAAQARPTVSGAPPAPAPGSPSGSRAPPPPPPSFRPFQPS